MVLTDGASLIIDNHSSYPFFVLLPFLIWGLRGFFLWPSAVCLLSVVVLAAATALRALSTWGGSHLKVHTCSICWRSLKCSNPTVEGILVHGYPGDHMVSAQVMIAHADVWGCLDGPPRKMESLVNLGTYIAVPTLLLVRMS